MSHHPIPTPPAEPLRDETDSLGVVRVPAGALFGASTQRALENFPVSGWRPAPRLIHALGLIKAVSARQNAALGRLPTTISAAIITAASEVAAGEHDAQFPVDVFQTGSGTSTHMNANEVIANRANQLLGAALGSRSPVHPNDHVNLGQSSNDVMPTATHIAAAQAVQIDLLPALAALHAALAQQAHALADVVKVGRTHLMDAVPVTLGQEFSGYAQMVGNGVRRIEGACPAVHELALGATAVGTGLGTDPAFTHAVIAELARETGLPFRQAPNLFEALAARDALVELSATLRSLAISLTKIANDVRWLGSGPRCGLGELRLPTLQPGSSIMPGKVNPVMPEMVLMVCAQVVGFDATVAWAGAAGNLELNAMIPLIAHNVLTSIEILARAITLFTGRCVVGLQPDRERCESLVEQSLALVTALAPRIGYDAAAAIAHESTITGKTIRQLCVEKAVLPAEELTALLDPRRMTGAPTPG